MFDTLFVSATAVGREIANIKSKEPTLEARVRETEGRDVAGLLELLELPGVLDQPHLRQHPREVVVAAAVGGHGAVDERVDAAQHPGLRRRLQARVELAEMADLEAQGVAHLL